MIPVVAADTTSSSVGWVSAFRSVVETVAAVLRKPKAISLAWRIALEDFAYAVFCGVLVWFAKAEVSSPIGELGAARSE